MAVPRKKQARIAQLLKNLSEEAALEELFGQALGYDRVERRLARQELPAAVAEALAGAPVVLATAGEGAGFRVLEARLDADPLDLAVERAVVNELLCAHPHALFVFSNRNRTAWHFVNVQGGERGQERRTLRRISVSEAAPTATAAQHLARIGAGEIEARAGAPVASLTAAEIQAAHDAAFDVDALTRDFYRQFVAVFDALRADLKAQTGDARWAHRYGLLFLSRCMVICFLQRKCWIGDDPAFLRSFWRAYEEAGRPRDTFASHWLRVLFFEALGGNGAVGEPFPPRLRQALRQTPPLRSGPFRPGPLDEQREQYGPVVSDAQVCRIFDFLGSFDFTIAENRPLDQQLAVDPEMIGKVYESLVNVSGDADERGEAGIFYTPRTEIDLMCRLSLVHFLARHLGEGEKETIYEIVFALDPAEKHRVDRRIATERWQRIRDLLKEVTVVDPACGAGSFLVGMLQVLDDLIRRAHRRLGIEASAYERRRPIVGRSLYGVDVKDWAVSIAQIRLWLALVVPVDVPAANSSSASGEFLLPEVSFNLRSGDALVQEVGGLDLGLDARQHGLASSGRAGTRGERPGASDGERLLGLLQDRYEALQEDIERLARQIESMPAPQLQLSGGTTAPSSSVRRKTDTWEEEKKKLQGQARAVEQVLHSIRADESPPFVWEAAFPEVFGGESSGFDIVIGNPPYVRQEQIADPRRAPEEVSRASKKRYKAKLARAVYRAFPGFFGYDPREETAAVEIDKKSDLYIYFYFRGLHLLNEKGTLCFIASNSWLDVGYGRQLQEFLLRQVPIRFVIDNQSRRSFEDADVNTAITVFSAPEDAGDGAVDHTARFVMLKVPFSQALGSECWLAAERQESRFSDSARRMFPVEQRALLRQGLPGGEAASNGRKGGVPPPGQYDGAKWGGKYLRAPEVFWDVVEKHRNRLVRLGDVADVRFGIKTGANAFFFLDAQDIDEWGIEERYLVPALKNSRDARQIVVDREGFPLKLFLCHDRREQLQGTAALEYIEAGEAEGLHERPTLASRTPWWSLGDREPAPIACNYQIGRVQHFFAAEEGLLVSNNFLFIYADAAPFALAATLNSSWTQLWTNVMGRANFGGGLLKIETYETANIMTIDPSLIPPAEARGVLERADLFDLDSDARRELDELVFSCAGFTRSEREAVTEALHELVRLRHAKSKSL